MGYTVAEALMAVVIIGFILGSIYSTLIYVENRWADDSAKTRGMQTANVAMSALSRALRGAIKPAPHLSAIELADRNEIRVYSDINADGKPERVHFLLSEGRLVSRVTEPTSGPPWDYADGVPGENVVARDLVNNATFPLLRYYKEDMTEFFPVSQSDRDLIRRIKVTPRVKPGARADVVELETDVTPRNSGGGK